MSVEKYFFYYSSDTVTKNDCFRTPDTGKKIFSVAIEFFFFESCNTMSVKNKIKNEIWINIL